MHHTVDIRSVDQWNRAYNARAKRRGRNEVNTGNKVVRNTDTYTLRRGAKATGSVLTVCVVLQQTSITR